MCFLLVLTGLMLMERKIRREKPRNYDFYQWRNGAELQGGGSGWGSDDMLGPMSNDAFKVNLTVS
jgi:hypothetical protein